MEGKTIREWRVLGSEGGRGVFVWFDPATERLELRDLTEEERSNYLDSLVSVSAMDEDEDATNKDACEGAQGYRPGPSFDQLDLL